MQNYYQDNFIMAKRVNNQGNLEIIFKDKSRYLGDFYEQMIQGVGIFYIQNVGRFDGDFFNNKFREGKLTFKETFVFKGEFNDKENFKKGKLTFLKNKISIEFEYDGIIKWVKVEEDEKEYLMTFKNRDRCYTYKNGWEIFIDENFECLMLQKRYASTLWDLNRTIINLPKNIFMEENYLQGKKFGPQFVLDLGEIPYYKEWDVKDNQFIVPKYFMKSVNGNEFNGTVSFKNGETTNESEEYVFEGPVEGPYKHGKGTIYFKDNCKKKVEFLNDKICFDSLSKVFEFVSNFGCFEHEALKVGNNLEMVKFMDKVESFKGHIKNGTTPEKSEIVFKNEDVYYGNLLNFKKHGRGVLIRRDCTITGNFVNDELTYGHADFLNGAKYEGQFLGFEISGKGTLVFSNKFKFIGSFVDGVIGKDGGKLILPNGEERDVFYVHIWEFNLGVFVVKETEELFLLECQSQTVHDAKLIEQLEESGINIRESLREIKAIK
jgi:hypothetical protein